MSRAFAPPNQAYHVCLRFLSSRQGMKELSDDVQGSSILFATPLSEAAQVTIFMEGLQTGTEVFRVHSSTFEEVANVALNATLNFKDACYDTQWHSLSSF